MGKPNQDQDNYDSNHGDRDRGDAHAHGDREESTREEPTRTLLAELTAHNLKVDEVLDAIEGNSTLVQTTYMCLRLFAQVTRLYDMAGTPHGRSYHLLNAAVRELQQSGENLEMHIQMMLQRLTKRSDRGGGRGVEDEA